MTRRFSRNTALLSLILLAAMACGAAGGEFSVKDERLAACPTSPNCVSTMATEESQAIAPFRFQKPLYEAKSLLIEIFGAFPGAELVQEKEASLQFEVRSFLFGFVDDVEFVFDAESKNIHFRAAARTGHYDFGVNRKRMEDLRGMLEGKL